MSQPTISPADRVRELSAINAEVPAMLSSAGNAISALTNSPLPSASSDGDVSMNGDAHNPASVAEHKEAFTKNATAYFTHLQAIVARLRRQAYALEEAGIIAADAPTLSNTSSIEQTQAIPAGQGAGIRRGAPVAPGMPQRQAQEEPERVTNGGLGNLDVGWLNSRANRVGKEKEAELIAEARKMLEDVVEKESSNGSD